MISHLLKNCSPKIRSLNALASILHSNTYNYVKKKDLDEIEKVHGTTNYQKMLMYMKQGKHIYLTGMSEVKKDMKDLINLNKKITSTATLTPEQEAFKKRMKKELSGLKTIFFIQVMPFSGFLLLYYIYAHPTSLPSWFTVDEVYDEYMINCIKKQQEAIEYFKSNPIDFKQFNLDDFSNYKLKLLSELLFGHYQDGAVGINKILKNSQRQYFISHSFSRFLIIRQMKKQFKFDLLRHPQIANMALEQKIEWKYQRVLEKGERVQFHPITEKYANYRLNQTQQIQIK